MTSLKAPDKRPALAFDAEKEVQTLLDALDAYRYSHIDAHRDPSFDEFCKRLSDQLTLVQQLFNQN